VVSATPRPAQRRAGGERQEGAVGHRGWGGGGERVSKSGVVGEEEDGFRSGSS